MAGRACRRSGLTLSVRQCSGGGLAGLKRAGCRAYDPLFARGRSWRLRHALSLSKAADALGVSRRMVAYYSSGEKKVRPVYHFHPLVVETAKRFAGRGLPKLPGNETVARSPRCTTPSRQCAMQLLRQSAKHRFPPGRPAGFGTACAFAPRTRVSACLAPKAGRVAIPPRAPVRGAALPSIREWVAWCTPWVTCPGVSRRIG